MKVTQIQPIERVMRKRVMQAFGLSAACAMAWYFGVQSLERRYGEARVQLASLQAKSDQYQTLRNDDDVITGNLLQIEAHLASVKAWSDAFPDPTATYDAIAKLAEEHNVVLESSDPSGAGQVPATPAPDHKEWPKVDPKQGPLFNYAPNVTGSKLAVSGSFKDVARFIGACQRELGLSRVADFRLSVANDNEPDQIQALITIQHFRFDRVELVPPKARGKRSSREK